MKYSINFPHKPIYGGPGSFQKLFTTHLSNSNKFIVSSLKNEVTDYVFVVNGSKRLLWLLRCKLKGSKIIFRVDGIDLKFKISQKNIKSYFLAISRLLIVVIIANFFADKIIFQSYFIKNQWEKFLLFKVKSTVIYNGVDENYFNLRNLNRSNEIICVEGEINSRYAVNILNGIKNYKITVVGNISDSLKKKIKNTNVLFTGRIDSIRIVELLNSHKIFLCLEENPPCPNSVIEAMSCNLPILGFDSGSLKELVDSCGILVNLKNNIISKRSIDNLNYQIYDVLKNLDQKNFKSRQRVLKNFSFTKIYKQYEKFITE